LSNAQPEPTGWLASERLLCRFYLYFILAHAETHVLVKAGISGSPLERAGALRRGAPLAPEMMGYAEIGTRKAAGRAYRSFGEAVARWPSLDGWIRAPLESALQFRRIVQTAVEQHASIEVTRKVHLVDLVRYFDSQREYAQSRNRRFSFHAMTPSRRAPLGPRKVEGIDGKRILR